MGWAGAADHEAGTWGNLASIYFSHGMNIGLAPGVAARRYNEFIVRATRPRATEGLRTHPLGAVLVGGASRRMGRDKARLAIEGVPLAEHVARVLEQVLSEVVLVVADAADPRFPDREKVVDRFPGCGPLAGLHAALLHANESRLGARWKDGDEDAPPRPVLLAACDLPGVTPELVRHVLGNPCLVEDGPQAEDEDLPRARVPKVNGRLHPLFALYAPGCLEVADDHLKHGVLEMHEFLRALRVTELPLTPELPWYESALLVNLNRPEDLRQFTEGSR